MGDRITIGGDNRQDIMDTREKVFDFIVSYKQAHDGLAPSYTEIMAACEIKSRAHVHFVLNALHDDGIINKGDGYRNLSVPGGRWIYDPEGVVV